MSSSSDEKKRMSGFTLNWFLEAINGSQLTEKLPPQQEDWRQEVTGEGGGEDEGGEGDAVGHQDEGEEPPSAWTHSTKLISFDCTYRFL